MSYRVNKTLLNAVNEGNLDVIKMILDNNRQIHVSTFINTIIQNGHVHIFKYLDECKYNVHNYANFSLACTNNKLELVEYMYETCKRNGSLIGHRNPIYVAAGSGSLETLKYLIEKEPRDIIDIIEVTAQSINNDINNDIKGIYRTIRYLINKLDKSNSKLLNYCVKYISTFTVPHIKDSVWLYKHLFDAGATDFTSIDHYHMVGLLNLGLDYKLFGENALSCVKTKQLQKKRTMPVLQRNTNIPTDVLDLVLDYAIPFLYNHKL